ncbi:MAG: hypothetical protein OXF20_00885 [Gammaproteobacteria bacterium]|nr:hypothetical protein [Gammaproteobacteria bacterium]
MRELCMHQSALIMMLAIVLFIGYRNDRHDAGQAGLEKYICSKGQRWSSVYLCHSIGTENNARTAHRGTLGTSP